MSLLEQIELFSAFSVGYCTVKRDSCIYQDLMFRQELEMCCFRVKLMLAKMQELHT